MAHQSRRLSEMVRTVNQITGNQRPLSMGDQTLIAFPATASPPTQPQGSRKSPQGSTNSHHASNGGWLSAVSKAVSKADNAVLNLAGKLPSLSTPSRRTGDSSSNSNSNTAVCTDCLCAGNDVLNQPVCQCDCHQLMMSSLIHARQRSINISPNLSARENNSCGGSGMEASNSNQRIRERNRKSIPSQPITTPTESSSAIPFPNSSIHRMRQTANLIHFDQCTSAPPPQSDESSQNRIERIDSGLGSRKQALGKKKKNKK